MPVPSPRSKLLPARGNYSDLAANVAELLDGEICYAIDQDQYYQKEGSVLVSVGATKAQGLLADSALQDAPSDGSEYVRKDGAWAVATGGGGGVAGVSSIIAGSGISIDQATGDVTITATGGGGGSGATQLNELTDVDLSTPATDGQVLAYDNSSSTFKPVAQSGGASTLDELTDVDLTSAPSNGQVLVYDSAESAFKPSTIVADGAGQPVIRYVINAAGTSAYTFTGPGFSIPTGNPELYVVRGQTYIFGNESGSHPFQIQSTAGSGGTAYSDGVTGNNSIGDVILTVPYDAPDTLYYQCTAHAPMGGTINVATVSAGGGGTDISTASIGDLADVDTTGVAPQDGDNLAWSEADSAWIPLSSGGGTNYGPFTPQNYHTFDSTDTASDASADLQDWDGPVTTDEFKVGTGACDGRPTNTACEAQGSFGDTGILTGNAFSINFWYYHDGVTEGTANNVIGCTKAGVTNPSGLLIRVLSSTFNLPQEMVDRGVQYQSLVLMNDSNTGALIGTKFPVLDGVWRHYSFTHDGNGLYKLWVDGVLHDSKDNGSAVDFSDAGIYGTFDGEFTLMGSRADGGGRNYGILDNFAIYDVDVFDGVDGVIPASALLQPSNQPFGFTISPPIGASTELSDFSPTPAADGQVPLFTSGEYVPSVLQLDNLGDVDTSTAAPTKGQLLSYNDTNSRWEPTDRGAGTLDPVYSAGVKSPTLSQPFESYGTGDFDDWADGRVTTGSKVGTAHCDYSTAAGSGCTDNWFVDDSGTWIEFWFKHDETAPGDQIVWGMAAPSAGTPQVGDSGFHMKLSFDTFELPKLTDHATALCVMKGSSNSTDVMLQTRATNPCDNEWHHIAIYLQPESEANGGSVFNNDGKFFLYVDGKLEDTHDEGGSFNMRDLPLSYSADEITLMANTNGSKNCRGQMDNFRIFTNTSLPVPFNVPAFVPNEDAADTPIAYALPAQVDSTLNLTDFSQVPAAEGETPIMRNGVYTPASHLNIIGFINSFGSNFPTPQSSDDDLSNFLGFPQQPGMCIVDTVDGSLWIWAGDYDPIDDVGGWVTVDLFSGGGAPA